MSQAVLAGRLGVSAAAVNKLEQAERHGGITIRKLAEVAAALYGSRTSLSDHG